MTGIGVGVECALRRAWTRRGRLLATVAAIAVGLAGLMLVGVAGTIAGDRALQQGIEGLLPAQQAFAVTMSPDLAPTSADLNQLNDDIGARLERRGLGPVLRTVEFRALAAGDGRTIRLAGLDEPHSAIRLTSGAWPKRCDADDCEVIALLRSPDVAQTVEPLRRDSPLGLTIVGTGVATSDQVLSGELQPGDDELIVIGDGVAKVSALPNYELFRRTYAWQVALEPGRLRSLDVGPLLAGVRSIGNDPSLSGFGLHVSGPEDRLLSISSRTRISDNRLAVPVGALLVLFFGVAVLAGLGGRADHRRIASVLRRRGANWSVMATFRTLEAALPVIGGLLVAAATAVSVGAWLGDRAGVGAASVLERSFTGSLVLRTAAVTVAVWLLIFVVLSFDDAPLGRRNRRPMASDIAGLSALAVLLVMTARGSISAASLNRDVDPSLVAVPVLAAIALASLVVRLVPITLRAASNASPRRWPLTKLTFAEATAQPLRSIASASLIAVTVMFALLTFGYASTLRVGSRDQAAFAVPYDFRLDLGAALVRPQATKPTGGWPALVAGTTATDVLRRGVAVRSSATGIQTVELLGVDPATLGQLHGWRPSFGPRPSTFATALGQPAPVDLGTPLPRDAVSIDFTGTGFEGLHTSAVIARADGTWHELTLDEEFDGGVRTTLSPGDAGGELVGFRLAQPADVSARVEHHIGEGDTSEPARAIDVVLREVHTVAADGTSTRVQMRNDRLRAADATVVVEPDQTLRVTGSLLGVAILVTPPGPGQDEPIAAVMDPRTARNASNGVVVIETSSGKLRLRPSVIVDRFPGVGSRFAILDISSLQPALDLLQPGAGTPNEVWLAADGRADEVSARRTTRRTGVRGNQARPPLDTPDGIGQRPTGRGDAVDPHHVRSRRCDPRGLRSAVRGRGRRKRRPATVAHARAGARRRLAPREDGGGQVDGGGRPGRADRSGRRPLAAADRHPPRRGVGNIGPGQPAAATRRAVGRRGLTIGRPDGAARAGRGGRRALGSSSARRRSDAWHDMTSASARPNYGGARDRHRRRVRAAPRPHPRCRGTPGAQPAHRTGRANRRSGPEWLRQVDPGRCRDCSGAGQCGTHPAVRA